MMLFLVAKGCKFDSCVTWLLFIHCDDINRPSWPRKFEIPTNKETSNQSKSIIGLIANLKQVTKFASITM